MPLISYDTKNDFDATYKLNAEPHGHRGGRATVYLHYNYCVLKRLMQKKAAMYQRLFKLNPSTKMLIVGAGYGWATELLDADAISTDTSTYIHNSKTTCECLDIKAAIMKVGLDPNRGEGLEVFNKISASGRNCLCGGESNTVPRCAVPLINETLTTVESRERLKTASFTPDLIITEYVLSCLTDEEIINFNTAIKDIGGVEVIHSIAHLGDGNREKELSVRNQIFNWKTLTEFKEMLPGEKFLTMKGEIR